jgi:hypothetical protein
VISKDEYRKILSHQTEEFLKTNKIKKFKFVKHKNVVKKPNSMSLPSCPECGSALKVESGGLIVCSQDRLKSIYDQCLQFHNGDEKTKIDILKNDKNGTFMELYDRWIHKDAQGNRSAFTCLYSNRLHSPIPHYVWTIVDVFQKRRLEKILKRPLAQSELAGETKIRYKNKKGYYIEEALILYKFPYEL